VTEVVPKPSDRSRRAVILASVGIVAILGLTSFIVAVGGNICQVRAVVKSTPVLGKEAVERLGGPKRALRRLQFYLRWPRWVAPKKSIAVLLMGHCNTEDAVSLLIKLLDHDDKRLRRSAAMALGEMGPQARSAQPLLLTALGDNHAIVRSWAASALVKIGASPLQAVPAIAALLEDPDVKVREAAATALGAFGPEAREAVPMLAEALTDSGPHVRTWAAGALGCIGPSASSAVAAIEKLLSDEREIVRDVAAEALRKIRGWAHPEEKPEGEAAPDIAPKTPAPSAPQGVEGPGQDAP